MDLLETKPHLQKDSAQTTLHLPQLQNQKIREQRNTSVTTGCPLRLAGSNQPKKMEKCCLQEAAFSNRISSKLALAPLLLIMIIFFVSKLCCVESYLGLVQ